MKYLLHKTGHWLLLFFMTDVTFFFVTWLLNPGMLKSVGLFLMLFTAIVLAAGYLLERRNQKMQLKALENFLENVDEESFRQLSALMPSPLLPAMKQLYDRFESLTDAFNEKQLSLENYRDYIEAWTHEMKTPLSLAALVMGNHSMEMSPYVQSRMGYVFHLISEDVERILYYARLQADHVDYHFSKVQLDECISLVLSDFQPYIEEKNITVFSDLQPLTVVTDKKVLSFMIAQLLSNAIKYADSQKGEIRLSTQKSSDKTILSVSDNGKGVLPEDAPFIFDKGFTGNHQNRQNATGMGLYLVKKFADAMCVEIRLGEAADLGEGFCIGLEFH
ncbi:MAG: sensor histidine kinase [Lachnospiraceae bacterium]|nr:sensor histidine kinase [Lachnospiraceae bacterium]